MNPAEKSLAVLLEYSAAKAADAVAVYKPIRKIEVISRNGKPKTGELQFALVGAGNLAKWAHLPSLKKIAGAGLRAVYSTSGVRGKSYAERFGADYATTEFEEILKYEAIDVVLVASRHREHAGQILAALRAGKHVFVEKPMGITAAECREITAAVRETGKQLTVGFNRRFAPFYVEMKRQIENRTAPAAVNIRMNSTGMIKGFWAAETEHGGAIVGEACHFVDLMTWLLNSEPESVAAVSMPTELEEPMGVNNIAAIFRFADGSIGNLLYTTAGSESSAGESVEVFAPGVAASSEDFKRLTIKKAQRKTKKHLFAEKGYYAQMESFIRELREGREPSVTVRDGARATIGALLMLESARTGEMQTFELYEQLLDEF